ncbi:hypothetical protein ES731_15030 [Psychroflexus gondwanensis]|jgi:hypothetical protein|uniref:hypothetical protein n=1 Tax=Psychroflexus gondwanensis TaxID=251 RepID=UPI0011BE0EAA|nr:hypothetical protein [Psychroflexus gondwanensis]TXE15722.1 hypothetical protein ES731_15030 [Psychroflexus gondwanensis]
MKIKPNAASNELSSPFYLINKNFCSDFENYIANKNGKVKGNYNAWSYLIFGKINSPKNWTLMYKKSTFTSGNLLLSSKCQNLLVLAEWETERKGTHNSEFEIRRKSSTDFFRKIVNKSLSDLDLSDKYVLEIKNAKSPLIFKLTSILKSLFLSGEIYKIEHRNDKLKIEMRTEKHHFEIFDKLIMEI